MIKIPYEKIVFVKLVKYILFYAFCWFIASGLLFYHFYGFFEEVEVASTGYNAKSSGFHSWSFSFIEHNEVGHISDSGTSVRRDRLFLEIRLCLRIGLILSLLLAVFNQLVTIIHNSVTRHFT